MADARINLTVVGRASRSTQMSIEDCIAEAEAAQRAEAFKEKLVHWRRSGVPVVLPDSFRAASQ